MKFLLTTIVVGSASIALAEGAPTINIEPSCRAAAKMTLIDQTYEKCRKSEEAAREALVRQWPSFPAADCNSCHRLNKIGTLGRCTERLTCLELRRDARGISARDVAR